MFERVLVGLCVRTGFWLSNRCWAGKNYGGDTAWTQWGQTCWACSRKVPFSALRCGAYPMILVMLRISFQNGPALPGRDEQALSDRRMRREKPESLLCPNRAKPKCSNAQIPKLSLLHWNRIINTEWKHLIDKYCMSNFFVYHAICV